MIRVTEEGETGVKEQGNGLAVEAGVEGAAEKGEW